MLETSEVSEIVKQVAARHFAPSSIERVITETYVDSTGDDAFQIIVVLTDDAARSFTGETSINLLTDVRDRLFERGDERFPFVGYATEKDLLEEDEDE